MRFRAVGKNIMAKKDCLVSAIVSVYNCERFIAGCLEDLERQTIADKLEIVAVNSGSQQNEDAIIKRFQAKYGNIVYIKTEDRETIYQAWNRGIKASRGKYITSANSDDRHRKDAFEVMAAVLEEDKDIALVYADGIATDEENGTFERHEPLRPLDLPDFDPGKLLIRCFIGPQPMWRRKVHDEAGYFDGSFKVAGDYEFWLRISKTSRMKHLKERLGLYFVNPAGAERINREITISETVRIRGEYMKDAPRDKSLLRAVRRKQSAALSELGYIYIDRKDFALAGKALTSSLALNPFNFKSYAGLLMRFAPHGPAILRKARAGRERLFPSKG